MEDRDRLHEVFERAATEWRDQVVYFAVTVFDNVLQDLRKCDKEDYGGAGHSSGGSAVS